MRRKWISIFILVFWSSTQASICDKKLPKNSVRDSVLKCRLNKAAKDASKIGSIIESKTAYQGFCQFVSTSTGKQGIKLCQSPAKTICKYKGKVLDSNCSYTPKAEEVVIDEKKLKSILCLEDEKTDADLLIASGKEKCSSLNLEGDECLQLLRFQRPNEDKNDFNNKIFTDEKIDLLFQLGERVKSHYKTLINSSLNLNDEKKKNLLDKISRTSIYVNQDRFENPVYADCYGSTDGKLSASVFNKKNDYGFNEIHFCSGFAMNMEYMNPHALFHIMAHEFAHSIDPCALEELQGGKPYEYKEFYPETVACLRGTKKGGCRGSELNCSGKKDLANYCKDKYPGEWKQCKKALSRYPSCVIGSHSHDEGFRQEQINEGFSDFMASEVLGLEMKSATPAERSDALVSITTQLSHRHDGCNQGPRTNSHPNLYQRVDTIMMSSEKGRTAIGCEQREGKKTCSSL
ncbi:MAG: hypothetical protein ACJAT2_002183 [Bacteriovoracaceae bacterium]